MTYTLSKPDPGPSPKLDAPLIKGNFSAYAPILAINHVALNQKNQGDHSQIIFEKQPFGPGVVESETVLFNKNASAATGGPQPQLFIKIPKFLPTGNDTSNATNTSMQLTYNTVNVAGPQYQSFLAGGYIVYFGSLSGMTVAKTVTVNLVTLTTVPTKILMAIAISNTIQSVMPFAPLNASTKVLTASTFNVYLQGNNDAVNIPYNLTWMAIGSV